MVPAFGDRNGPCRPHDGGSGVVRSFDRVRSEYQLLPSAVRIEPLVSAVLYRAESDHQMLGVQRRQMHVLRVLAHGLMLVQRIDVLLPDRMLLLMAPVSWCGRRPVR